MVPPQNQNLQSQNPQAVALSRFKHSVQAGLRYYMEGFQLQGSYTYEPITAGQIRLLYLLPQNQQGSHDSLKCILLQISVKEAAYLPYEALSYAWGHQQPTESVQINGKLFKVTRTLFEALDAIRGNGSECILWVDAICINQADNAEKSHQVSLMRSIYRQARQVLVWLGMTNAEHAGPAFEIVEKIFQRQSVPPAGEAWSPVAALFALPWFWRLWCIQEIVLCSKAVMLWGKYRIEWGMLSYAAGWIRTTGYEIIHHMPMPGVYNGYMMYYMYNNSAKQPISFLSLLMVTRQFGASDPRDRVFALLGLPCSDASPEHSQLFLAPDYTKSKKQVYLEVAKAILHAGNNLLLLSTVQHGINVVEDIPSWVPQWDRVFTHTLAPADPHTRTFNASPRSTGSVFAISDENILTVTGVQFDRIDKVSAIIPSTTEASEQATVLASIWDEIRTSKFAYSSAEKIVEAFCWTITAGKDWYGMLVQDSNTHTSDFIAFWNEFTGREDSHQFAGVLETGAGEGDAFRFAQAVSSACAWRRFFITSNGYIGVGPPCTTVGDRACVLEGGIVPFLLRPGESGYKLVGEAYIHGVMHGEMTKAWYDGGLNVQEFAIS